MNKFKTIFDVNKPVIGMIHVQSLPGTPRHSMSNQQILDSAMNEARIHHACGVDAIMIENMHDVPYLKETVGPEISTAMAIIANEIKKETKLPLGIQILAAANKQALAAAKASNADFIRAEGFVFAHVADEGMIDAQAGELLRYRKHIDAENIAIFADIKKKHSSHAMTKDVNLLDTAKAAEFFLSDGVIITGNHTGVAPSLEELQTLKGNLDIPVILGSGITSENVTNYLPYCDALVVGSYFKEGGHWKNALSKERVISFMDALNRNR